MLRKTAVEESSFVFILNRIMIFMIRFYLSLHTNTVFNSCLLIKEKRSLIFYHFEDFEEKNIYAKPNPIPAKIAMVVFLESVGSIVSP